MDHVEFQESSENFSFGMSKPRREIQEGLRYISVIVKLKLNTNLSFESVINIK